MSLSALMILHDPVLNSRSRHRHAEKISIIKAIADVVQDSRVFITRLQSVMSINDVSPLHLHWAYQAMSAFATLVPKRAFHYAEAIEIL